MNDNQQPDLEAFIHEELKRLPELSPPAALSQRVRKAIIEAEAEAARPWWRRAWWSWPRSVKVLSGVLFGLLALIACAAPWALGEVAAAVTEGVGQWLSPLFDSLGTLASLLSALELLGRSIAHNPWVLIVAAASLGAYLLLIGVGTFYVRFAVHHSRTPMQHD